ncbi:hypothetical protein [Novosphingobium sp. MMS21-SN21R]|uniref:hypothetical protein n=1 Tax=Novosphingobium sp. MMS21-SN21R TaxID=2969298 RepID=UPI002885BC17|nr:hypothetical protein [Novosphingobium sp. MMS21-SN21R]MDT0507165.1 hypothetical protein [Novosphingobium sp. MMS21-SN21R]
MIGIATTRIRPLTEDVCNEIIEAAGGRRAHPDQAERKKRNADYILGDSVIELKILEDEGLSKTERQRKLAEIFTALDPDRPVYVLDRGQLDLKGQRAYDRAMESPIKSAVKSAKGQLIQTRSEVPNTKRSILLLVNNGNTALDHGEICELAGRRARNDTDDIDGVVVAGAYLHSDGFDTLALWPIHYVPVSLDQPFPEYDALHEAFHGYAERAMTEAVKDGLSRELTKGPVLDTGFDLDGKTFVKPAPPLGQSSDFYVNGRPRLNSAGDNFPPVGLVFPELDRAEWNKFREFMPDDGSLGDRYEDWLAERERALGEGTELKPTVPMTVTLDGWLASLDGPVPPRRFGPVRRYATTLFQQAVNAVLEGSRSVENTRIVPSRFVLVTTEVIGQDQANDVSHILLVEPQAGAGPRITTLVKNARIRFQYAGALGASYAVKHSASSLQWQKDKTYAWQ